MGCFFVSHLKSTKCRHLFNLTNLDRLNYIKLNSLALSLFVLSLTVTRLALAGLLRRLHPRIVLIGSLLLSLLACLLLWNGEAAAAMAGLVLLGIGVAAGFPVILGYLGDLFTEVSGTAFSIALSIGLFGNMLANYVMGAAAEHYGMIAFSPLLALLLAMQAVLLVLIIRRLRGKTER